MTDLETLTAMLDRVGIPHDEPEPRKSADWEHTQLPDGAQALLVLDHHSKDRQSIPWRSQPMEGGYGFFAEFVFDVDGKLLALWLWE